MKFTRILLTSLVMIALGSYGIVIRSKEKSEYNRLTGQVEYAELSYQNLFK